MNEIILTSSVLILVIAALRRLFRGNISPTLQYALWLLVVLRLLIPGTLFSAPITVVGLAEEIKTAVADSVIEDTAPANTPSSPIHLPGETIPGETIPIDPLPTPELNTPPADISPTPQSPTTSTTHRITINWPDVIWKAGIVTVSVVFIIGNLVFYLGLRRKRVRIPAGELPIVCPIPVYYVNGLASPCLFGLKSAIYVNDAAMHPQRLRHVLTHELSHHRHGDHFWALLRCVCLAIHWYNPLVWWAAVLSRRDSELSCDSAVIRSLGESSGISYGETLMAMVTASPASLLHTATTMSAGKRIMAERLKLIVHRPRMMKLTVAVVTIMTIGAVVLTFGGCADQQDDAEAGSDITINENILDTGENTTPTPPDDGEDDGGSTPLPETYTHTHPSGLFSMEIPYDPAAPYIVVDSEDGTSIYRGVYTPGSDEGWILSIYPLPTEYLSDEINMGKFNTNGTSQTYVMDCKEDLDPMDELFQTIAGSFKLNASAELFSQLIHDSFEDDMALAISYLPYLSWSNYYQEYGEDGMMDLLSALWKFADTGNATWDQYHDMLSMTDAGLDGAYSEGLSGIFEALFLRNQERFLSVINSTFITDTERARVAAYVKYSLESQPSEGDSEEVVFSDGEIMNSYSRVYGSTAWDIGSPAGLTLTLTGDWTLDGIRAGIFAALSQHLTGTLLEGDLTQIEIGYSFRFPEEMRDGVTLTVPFHAHYTDQDVFTLPSGTPYSPSSRTGELTAEILLVGEGITAPVDEEFARGQALYDLLAEIAAIREPIEVSVTTKDFQLLNTICELIEQRLEEAGLSEQCRRLSGGCGGYSYPGWCDIGYEQTTDYQVTLQYIEGDWVYKYTFHYPVTIVTTE